MRVLTQQTRTGRPERLKLHEDGYTYLVSMTVDQHLVAVTEPVVLSTRIRIDSGPSTNSASSTLIHKDPATLNRR
jgi:hypothetical protein